jgi:integrase
MAPRKPTGVDIRVNADGSKSYHIRWRDGGGRGGAWCSHTFDRRQDAIDARRSIEVAGWRCFCPRHAPAGTEPGSYGAAAAAPLTFGTFARRHAAALTGIGKGYRSQFEKDLDRHFKVFLDVPLVDVTDMTVREWIRGKEETLSPTTIRRLLVQAASVVTAGQTEGIIVTPRNPFKGHRLQRRDRDQHTEMRILTHEQWAGLQAALPEGVYRDLCTVLVGTGLRFGEATALWRGAVDDDAVSPRLHVARAWKSDGHNGYELGTPKSMRSRRTVEYGQAVADALAPHLTGEPTDFVFTTERGKFVRHSNFYHRVWRPAVARAGLDGRLRIHDLRHTHVSWLLAAGRPIDEVSLRVGHESITTTVDRYRHLLPTAGAGAVAALDAVMSRPRG